MRGDHYYYRGFWEDKVQVMVTRPKLAANIEVEDFGARSRCFQGKRRGTSDRQQIMKGQL